MSGLDNGSVRFRHGTRPVEPNRAGETSVSITAGPTIAGRVTSGSLETNSMTSPFRDQTEAKLKKLETRARVLEYSGGFLIALGGAFGSFGSASSCDNQNDEQDESKSFYDTFTPEVIGITTIAACGLGLLLTYTGGKFRSAASALRDSLTNITLDELSQKIQSIGDKVDQANQETYTPPAQLSKKSRCYLKINLKKLLGEVSLLRVSTNGLSSGVALAKI